jgi:hypothetical protein
MEELMRKYIAIVWYGKILLKLQMGIIPEHFSQFEAACVIQH